MIRALNLRLLKLCRRMRRAPLGPAAFEDLQIRCYQTLGKSFSMSKKMEKRLDLRENGIEFEH